MPTNRPFLSNFLAAFRAHSAITQTKASPQPSSSHNTSSHPHTTTTSVSSPRTITTSAKPGATTSALTSIHSPRTHSASPLSRSPGNGPSHMQAPENFSPSTATTSPSNGVSAGGMAGQQRYMTSSRGRRGSDSSSEGFRDVLGAEKWYIGGRTATGEERYFKLGVVRRRRSGGSLSLDRLSL